MRTIPSALQTSLSSSAFALATLIKLIKIDGQSICMTTWDKPLIADIDGEGNRTYEPQDIESVTKFAAAINAAIDDAELVVPINVVFTGDDIRRQFYAGSIVKIAYMDPDDSSTAWLHRYYEVGLVKIDGAKVIFELLGPEKRLESIVNVPLTLNCRYQFGDSMCGINLEVPVWQANTIYNEGDEVRPTENSKVWFYAAQAGTGGIGTSGPTEPIWGTALSGEIIDNDIIWHEFNARRIMGVVTAVTDARNFGANGIDVAPDFFTNGYIVWLYGRNAGEKQRVKYDGGDGSIIQHRPCLDVPQIGDTFYAVVGCRKRITEDCVIKHDNKNRSSSRTLRFGGFPFLAPEQSTLSAPTKNNNDD